MLLALSVPLASFPSPSDSDLELGPLTVNYYGICIAIGVALAFWLTRRRFERFGGDGEMADRVSLWAVGIGFLGARTAYVITHTDRFFGADAPLDPWQVIAIWEGGIAFFGGLTAGTLTAVWLLRHWEMSLPAYADSVAVALPLAQGVGRWGNWFNQELFGTPTDLPWAVEIDPGPAARAGFPDATTFHPAFLYESLFNLLVVVPLLLWLDRRSYRRGALILAYLVLYGTIRFLLELIRTDTTFRLLGLSRNGWVALAVTLGGAIAFVRYTRTEPPATSPWRPTPSDDDAPDQAAEGDEERVGVS